VEHRVDKALASVDTIKFAALMGAFLGRAKAPVDLFIIGSVGKDAFKKIIGKMEKTIGKDVNYTIMPLSEYEYRREIADKFLSAVLESPKNVVVDRLNDPLLH
jgi:hypothetical protein